MMFFYQDIQKLNDTDTVLRFCEKLGCEGYNDFKEELKKYIETSVIIPPQPDLAETLNYFKGVNTPAFEEELAKAAEIIRGAKNLFFYGMGSSAIMGKYAARYFSSFGKLAWNIDDITYPITADITEDTVLFVFSVSGETAIVANYILNFKKQKSKILSVTNTPNCTIAKLSDWNINYNTPKQMRNDGMQDLTSQVPVIFLVEALARRI